MEPPGTGPPSTYRGGTGEPLLLVHGGGGTWRQWAPTIPLLEPQHDVLAINMVGHWGGPPAPPADEVSLDVLVDGAERDMDAAGWETAHVAGSSLGGLVALVLARRGRARTCTAMNTVGGWDEGGDAGLRLVSRSYRLFHRGAQLLARDPARWTRRPRLRRLLYWHHFARTDRMNPVETAYLLRGMAHATILGDLLAWAQANEGPTGLDEIRCPVQVVFAERDRIFPRRRYEKRLVETLPHAEVHELPGAGHVATWDAPEAVADVLLRFTARHRGAG